jgi:hypothetical protein
MATAGRSHDGQAFEFRRGTLKASGIPGKKGRKRVNESRAIEIRARLTEWKQLPESSRPSLRALARELGTSHQLLCHYLRHWDVWRAEEYRRQANELRRRARTETRPWVVEEILRQARAYDQAAFLSTMEFSLGKLFTRLQRDAKAHPLNRGQVKLLSALALRGSVKAREILEGWGPMKKPRNNLPLRISRAGKSFGSGEGVAGNSSKTRPRARRNYHEIGQQTKGA